MKKSPKQMKQALEASAARHKRKEIAGQLSKSLRELRTKRKELLAQARNICSRSKARTREAVKAYREAERERIRAHVTALRQQAIMACAARRQKINEATASTAQKKRLLAKEQRELQKELREITGEKKRKFTLENRRESDSEVRHNIDPVFHAVWERVKSHIKHNPRASRTEVFLEWMQENQEEVDAMLSGMGEDHLDDIEKLNKSITRKLEKAKPGKLPSWTRAEAKLLEEQGVDPYDLGQLGLAA